MKYDKDMLEQIYQRFNMFFFFIDLETSENIQEDIKINKKNYKNGLIFIDLLKNKFTNDYERTKI